jgi:hypothetical protein
VPGRGVLRNCAEVLYLFILTPLRNKAGLPLESRLLQKEVASMRRILVLLTMVALGVVLSAGVALALNQIDCASIQQFPQTPSCFGTDQADQIEGQDTRDIIYAKGGNDIVQTQSGNDVVYSGAGADYAVGAEGNDLMYGAGGADQLTDEAYVPGDTDEQRGQKGADILSGYDQDYNDTLVCGAGANDTVYFDRTSSARDTVSDTCEHRHPNQSDGF